MSTSVATFCCACNNSANCSDVDFFVTNFVRTNANPLCASAFRFASEAIVSARRVSNFLVRCCLCSMLSRMLCKRLGVGADRHNSNLVASFAAASYVVVCATLAPSMNICSTQATNTKLLWALLVPRLGPAPTDPSQMPHKGNEFVYG
eukprot:565940-Amphidinium_carterae.2